MIYWNDMTVGAWRCRARGGYLHVLWWACCQIIGLAVWATHLSTWTWLIWPHPCQLPSRVSLLNSWATLLSPLTCQHNSSHKICIMLQCFSFIRKGNYNKSNSNNFLISCFFFSVGLGNVNEYEKGNTPMIQVGICFFSTTMITINLFIRIL